MKQLFLLIGLISIGAFSQTNPSVFKNGVDTKLIALDTLTTAQRNAISVKASKGYIIFNADTNVLNLYNGTSWAEITGGGGTDDQTLQEVLTSGNESTTNIILNEEAGIVSHQIDFNDFRYSSLFPSQIISRDNYNWTRFNPFQIELRHSAYSAYIKADNITGSDKTFQQPNQSGTYALQEWVTAQGYSTGTGHTIQDNGVSKTARTNLNFKNFVVDDNAANNSTDITAVVAGAPLTYNYTAVGAETSINTGVSIASNYQTEIYYGNAVLSPTIDYTLSYGATTTINFTFALEAGYPIRVVYNSSSAPNAITDTDDVPEGTTNLYADSNATNQGNTFNGANQLVKLDGTGKLPAIDGSNLTNLPSSGDMLKSENLSGLANYTTARSNLGLVIGTNVLAPNGSAAGLTSFPIFNQNTTGSAATLTTPRTINGTSFNGSANITTTNWGTSRNISIGGTSKAVTGGANVTWTQSEIGVNKTTIDALGINATATTTSTSTGTAIDMGYKRQMNFGAASSASTFTLTNIAIGGYAEVLINGTTEPTVTGATKLPDTASWVTGTDMVLCVKDFNGTRKYWFVKF